MMEEENHALIELREKLRGLERCRASEVWPCMIEILQVQLKLDTLLVQKLQDLRRVP